MFADAICGDGIQSYEELLSGKKKSIKEQSSGKKITKVKERIWHRACRGIELVTSGPQDLV